jgi:hypothetical protein
MPRCFYSFRSYSKDIAKAVAEATSGLNERHARDYAELKDLYERTKLAYKDLEVEFKNGLQGKPKLNIA